MLYLNLLKRTPYNICDSGPPDPAWNWFCCLETIESWRKAQYTNSKEEKRKKILYSIHGGRDQLDPWRHEAVNASTAELPLVIVIHTQEMVCVCCDNVRQRLIEGLSIGESWLRHSSGTLGISCFIVSSSDFPTLSMNMWVSEPSLLPLFLNFSLSFTFTFLCYTFLSLCPPSPSFSSLTFCLAHTGDNSNSKHCRVKTNLFCHSENKPLFLSLSFSSSLSRSPSSPYLATVKINCSVSIYFT